MNNNDAETEKLINDTLFKSFDTHVEDLEAARLKRIEALSFKSALEDDGAEEVNADASQDEIDGLGMWMQGDEYQGDVNYRTLQKLLARVDQRGYERCASANPLYFSNNLRISSLLCSHQVVATIGIPHCLSEGSRPCHLQGIVGNGTTVHHEEVWMGD